jgi:hypothetical protein
MKKLISLILVLVLSLTALSAFAADALPSPNALNEFSASGENLESKTEGIKVNKPVPEESKNVVNELVKSGDLVKNLYENTTFVDKDGQDTGKNEVEGKNLTNITMIPFPGIDVDDDVVTAGYGELSAPIPAAIAEYLEANKENVIAFFNYQVEGQFFTTQIDFEIVKTGLAYTIVYKIPVEVLKLAEGNPSFVTFELVKE